MRRRDLIKQLDKIAKAKGEELHLTEGGNHIRATIGTWSEPIPRHREVNELLAKAIIRRTQK